MHSMQALFLCCIIFLYFLIMEFTLDLGQGQRVPVSLLTYNSRKKVSFLNKVRKKRSFQLLRTLQ